MSAKHKSILKNTAGNQALKGLFNSGRLYLSSKRPSELARAKNCPGYPSTSRINVYTSPGGGRVMTSKDGM